MHRKRQWMQLECSEISEDANWRGVTELNLNSLKLPFISCLCIGVNTCNITHQHSSHYWILTEYNPLKKTQNLCQKLRINILNLYAQMAVVGGKIRHSGRVQHVGVKQACILCKCIVPSAKKQKTKKKNIRKRGQRGHIYRKIHNIQYNSDLWHI